MVKLLGYEDLLRATQLYSGLPQGCATVHARFEEGLMCIMMSTSRLTLTPIICIPYCTIKEITTA